MSDTLQNAGDVRCRRCDAPMQLGFLLDAAGNNIGAGPDVWIEGQPEAYKLFGMRTGSVKTQGHTRYTVTAYRCPQCAGVDLFAPADDTFLPPASNP